MLQLCDTDLVHYRVARITDSDLPRGKNDLTQPAFNFVRTKHILIIHE